MPDDDDENNHHHGEKFVAPPDFSGPTDDRHCTDILCFLLLIAMWIALTGIGIYSIKNGDYRLVLYPLDYDGNVCGTDFAKDMTDYPYLLYVNYYAGVCVKECPDLTGQVKNNLTDVYTMVTYDGIFQPLDGNSSELSADFIQVGDYSNSSDALKCTDDTCYNGSPNASWYSKGINEGYGFAYYAVSTYELLWSCYALDAAIAAVEEQVGATDSGGSLVNQAFDFWNKVFADIYVARKYILAFGFGASLALSFGFIFLMRLPVILNALVWSSIFISIALFFIGGYYTWQLATDWSDADPQTVDDTTIHVTSGASIALYVIGGLLIVLTCCLRTQIQLAIGCVKEAGRAVNQMSLILLLPVLQAAGLSLFMVAFTYYGINLASMATISTVEIPTSIGGETVPYRVFTFDDFTKNCGWYMLFSLFWTANLIVALGDVMIAVAVSRWYFTRNKMTIGSWTVLNSVRITLLYHVGTCAFGALIIAIIQMIRALIARAQNAARKADSKVAQVLLCCCQCCFCCLEKCLKFINKNAYIQTAIFSTAFCKSCRKAFGLIFRNASRIGAVTYVSAAVLIVGKLFISSVTTVLGYYMIVEEINDELYSVGGPIVLIFLISYWMSDFFMDVFDMSIITILHCFIADEEMFNNDQVYAEHALREWIDKHGAPD